MPTAEGGKDTLRTPATAVAESPVRVNSIWQVLSRHWAYCGLAVLLLATEATAPAFLSWSNLSSLLQQYAPLAIVVTGQTFVVLVGGLDLSVSSVMATAAVVAAAFSGRNTDLYAIVGCGLLVGFVVGSVNGILVAKRSVSPFLATLATWTVLEGLRYAYNDGAPSSNVPPILRALGAGHFYGIPYNLLLAVALAAAGSVVLQRTTLGRRVYLVGGNARMARLVGIDASSVTMLCYIISGVLASVAGIVLSGYTSVVDNYIGRGFELDSIVAVMLGGGSLAGGRGRLTDALGGTAVLILISNAILFLGLPIPAQLVIKGLVVVLAATLPRIADEP